MRLYLKNQGQDYLIRTLRGPLGTILSEVSSLQLNNQERKKERKKERKPKVEANDQEDFNDIPRVTPFLERFCDLILTNFLEARNELPGSIDIMSKFIYLHVYEKDPHKVIPALG